MLLKLQFKDVHEVKRFVDITNKYSEELSLVRGRYTVDAKSILGIFSMDLAKPLELVCDHENEDLLRELAPFLAA